MAERDLASCRNCGYDLTGVESEVCPECGKPVATSGPFFEQLLAKTRGTGLRRCAVCKTVAEWPDTVCPTCGSKIGTPVGGPADKSAGELDGDGDHE